MLLPGQVQGRELLCCCVTDLFVAATIRSPPHTLHSLLHLTMRTHGTRRAASFAEGKDAVLHVLPDRQQWPLSAELPTGPPSCWHCVHPHKAQVCFCTLRYSGARTPRDPQDMCVLRGRSGDQEPLLTLMESELQEAVTCFPQASLASTNSISLSSIAERGNHPG